MTCPICDSSHIRAIASRRRFFFRCGGCAFAWADPATRLDPEAARARYALHRNRRDDAGYMAFLGTIIDAALAHTPGARRVLDWGSGPAPVGADLLRERGMAVSVYDPLYAPVLPEPEAVFDLVFCIEVAEHFERPLQDFADLASRLRPGAGLALHTHLAPEDDEAFLSWWYTEDPTHVSFHTLQSLTLLADLAALRLDSITDRRLALFRRPLPVLVVGGMNLDIEGSPDAEMRMRDSNPGRIRFAPGGAGRNVAENLARLGLPVELVSAVGPDAAGSQVLDQTAAAGVGVRGVAVLAGESTSCYVSVLDGAGDMAVAVAGMGIYDAYLPDRALAALALAEAAARERSFCGPDQTPFSAVVLDGNLLPECLEAVLDRYPGLDAWFDPVSAAKARRFAVYKDGVLLGRLQAAKPNLLEARALALGFPETPVDAADDASTRLARAREYADFLRSRGLPLVLVSLGGEGVLWSDAVETILGRPPSLAAVSATGAGDAFLAGALRYMLTAVPAAGAAALLPYACAASALTLQDAAAVSPRLSARDLVALTTGWRRDGSFASVILSEQERAR